jgi:hypothetical protein
MTHPRRKRRENVKSPIVGFKCINKLMNRVIGKVLTKARSRDKSRIRRLTHKESDKTWKKKHYERNKTEIRRKQRNYNSLHINENKKRCSKHYTKNKADRMKKHLKYKKERRKTDNKFVVYERSHARLANFMKKRSKNKTTITAKAVGMSANDLAEYLEKCSTNRLTIIGNHIDHIFAIAKYTEDECESKAMNYSNLQILTAKENIYKKDRLPTKAMAAKVERWAWPDGITEADLPDIYPGWSTPLRM